MIKTKRIYSLPDSQDGLRYLVDRLWPRGLRKEQLHIDGWLKGIAPSTELRKWYHKDRAKFDEFRSRYMIELESKRDYWQEIVLKAKNQTVTLLYAARDQEHNHAIILKEFLDQKI